MVEEDILVRHGLKKNNFQIIHPGIFHSPPYKNSNLKSFDKFINFLSDKKSIIFLYWHALEFVGEPFHTINEIDENSINKMNKVLIERDIIIYVLYGGFDDDYYNNLNKLFLNKIIFLYWPTHLLHYTKYYLEKSHNKLIKEISVDNSFNKLFFCLNHNPRPHKSMIIDTLFKNNLFENNIITWNLLTSEFGNKYNFNYWEEKIMTLDLQKSDDFNYNYDMSKLMTDKILNLNCLLNLNIETHYNYHFITEKTYKNILTEQPFFTFGFTGINDKIKELGFVLYDEIIDYSYDKIECLEERVEMYVDNLNKLKSLNYSQSYKKIEDKIKFNKQRAIEIINNDLFIPEFIDKLIFENFDKFKKIFKYDMSSYPHMIEIIENKK